MTHRRRPMSRSACCPLPATRSSVGRFPLFKSQGPLCGIVCRCPDQHGRLRRFAPSGCIPERRGAGGPCRDLAGVPWGRGVAQYLIAQCRIVQCGEVGSICEQPEPIEPATAGAVATAASTPAVLPGCAAESEDGAPLALERWPGDEIEAAHALAVTAGGWSVGCGHGGMMLELFERMVEKRRASL